MFAAGLFSSSTTSGISASAMASSTSAAGKTKVQPHFASFLLPSIPVPFRRRSSTMSGRTTAISASSPPSLSTSPFSDAGPSSQPSTPPDTTFPIPSSETAHAAGISRLRPDTLRCRRCSADVALAAQIVSKGFTGRHGRAYLVAPSSSSIPPPSPPPASSFPPPAKAEGLANITIGDTEKRMLVTGMHKVADINCALCRANLGWKYADAAEGSQRYKIGKYILETARVVEFRSWEDDGGCVEQQPRDDITETNSACRRESLAARTSRVERVSEDDDDENGEPVVFDSDDEEECEDIFAGVWNARVVAERRSSRASAGRY